MTPERVAALAALGDAELIPDLLRLAPALTDDDSPALTSAFAGRVVELPLRDGRFVVDLGSWTSWLMLRLGGWEPHLARVIARLVAPGTLAVDAGAHVGAHTVRLASLVGEGGMVWAFEPGAQNADLLERTIHANALGGRVQVHRAALGDRDGDAPLHRYAGGAGYPAADGMLFSLLAAPGYVADGITRVVRLDSLAGEVDLGFLKLDVEGAELAVLRGARETLARGSDPRLLVELHPAESPLQPVLDELAAQGFGVLDVRPAADRLVLDRLAPGATPTTHHVVARRDARPFEVMLV